MSTENAHKTRSQPTFAFLGLLYKDKRDWDQNRSLVKPLFISSQFNDLLERMGYSRYPNDETMPSNQCFTVYAYPQELNYPEVASRNDWFNLELFNFGLRPASKRKPLNKLVPQSFLDQTLEGNFSGKLIYLSLGPMGSVDVELMQRLVRILSGTQHKYIVSQGHRLAEYDLAPNMWGDQFVPQINLLPHVDLVITHGGNNSVTEVFAQGKPMIVMPLLMDQHDNGRRVQETGFGVQLDPYDFEDEDLVKAIERLLNDQVLAGKLHRVRQRLSKVDHFEEFADRVEAMFAP